ncbi:MAG TPA: hypothetical protein VK716_05030 [Terracidiphilus sp.]|nr:hypothetical protein [Terracidiphilus sp.]
MTIPFLSMPATSFTRTVTFFAGSEAHVNVIEAAAKTNEPLLHPLLMPSLLAAKLRK